jgi:hypothetical protein
MWSALADICGSFRIKKFMAGKGTWQPPYDDGSRKSRLAFSCIALDIIIPVKSSLTRHHENLLI